jgi:hypothetical protein
MIEYEIGGECSTRGNVRKYTQHFSGDAEGKRQLGRPRGKDVENINMNLTEISLIWFRIRTRFFFFEHGNEPYIKQEEFLT